MGKTLVLLGLVVLACLGVTATGAAEVGFGREYAPPAGWPADAQSTTGPRPPVGLPASRAAAAITSPQVIAGVPAYLWHHGCGPTAAGMIVGYWDGHGFGALIEGDASTQNAAVNTAIASSGNYNDYCLPLDSAPNPIEPDKSEPPEGDEHPDDCVADFMKTSQSYYDNYYGWSWFSDVREAFLDYATYTAPDYSGESERWYWNSGLTWTTYRTEIDAGRPMVLLVDTGGDNTTDHFVTAIGYGWDGETPMYACFDTWGTSVQWHKFAGMKMGQAWGIFGAITLRLSAAHGLLVTAGPSSPSTVMSEETCLLSASYEDTLGHGVASWSWNDGGAGGAFSPSAAVQNPTYTAPVNEGYGSVTVTLTVTATCDGPEVASGSDAVELIVRSAGTVDPARIVALTEDGEKYQQEAATDGRRVVWSDEWDGSYGIRLYDFDTDELVWIAEGSTAHRLGAVSGDIVLWLDATAGSGGFHTFLYDLETATEFQVSETARLGEDPSALWPPAVDGSLVAYTEPAGVDDWDLCCYDLSVDSDSDSIPNWRDGDRPEPDPARRALVVNPGEQSRPKVSGRRIVWEDRRSGNGDIYLYDLDLDQEFALCAIGGNQVGPDISGRYVVWTDLASGSGDVMVYDLSVDSDGDGLPNWRETPPPSPDPALRNLTPDAARQGNCAVERDYVVWEDDRAAGASATDIYLYDLGSETRFKLTEDEWDQSRPDISEGVVVWQDDSYGTADVFAWGSPDWYGSIEGHVYNARTMQDLVPAYLTCGEVTRFTTWDLPGYFVMPFVPTGPAQTMVVSSPTYHTHEVAVDVVGGDSMWLDVLLVPWGYGLVEGTVREGGTLEPLTDVQVSAGDAMAFTDSDGRYVLCLPGAQSYTITAAKYGYGEGSGEVASLADGQRVSLDFVLERLPRGTLAGLVKNARTEAAVAGATVTCGGASTTTGADGRYQVEVVAGSGLTVTASSSGYYPGRAKEVVVAADATTTVNLVLTPYFSDVAQSFWAFAEIGACVTAGVVAGYTDGTYQPAWPVTRDQMAVYIARALAGGEANVPEFTGTPTFADVDDLFWALKHVECAVNEGVVAGYDDELYHPEYEVDRGQMAAFVARAVAGGDGNVPTPSGSPTFPDVDSEFWAYRHVEYCVGEGIVRGYDDDYYHPEIVVTRDQMAVYVARAFGL